MIGRKFDSEVVQRDKKMVHDARDNAAEDRIFQELVTLRNQADTLLHTVRSSMDSLGESLNPGDKNTLNNLD